MKCWIVIPAPSRCRVWHYWRWLGRVQWREDRRHHIFGIIAQSRRLIHFVLDIGDGSSIMILSHFVTVIYASDVAGSPGELYRLDRDNWDFCVVAMQFGVLAVRTHAILSSKELIVHHLHLNIIHVSSWHIVVKILRSHRQCRHSPWVTSCRSLILKVS